MTIPVIDLFAGPGGLGEGFASYGGAARGSFRLSLSIEKDENAHRTLLLRSFFRRLRQEYPQASDRLLRGEATPEQLMRQYPRIAASASSEAVRLELSEGNALEVRKLVDDAVSGEDLWVLIGGPPCQAYSLIGRARNRGIKGYVPEADTRQTLYVEYLQILADHAPPVFVMENVKGLLSARLYEQSIFERILNDLTDPLAALKREGRKRPRQRPRYSVLPLTQPPSLFPNSRDYLVRSEDFGIPQARHRVILVGIREDSHRRAPMVLQQQPLRTVKGAINDLPRLRSGMSEIEDSGSRWIQALRRASGAEWFYEVDTDVRRTIRDVLRRLREPDACRGSEVMSSAVGTARSIRVEHALFNHSSRAHITADLERYLFASAFAQVRGYSPPLTAFPKGLLPAHRNAAEPDSKTPFADRFRVQVAGRVASTVTSHIAKDGHYYIHFDPSQCRSLTVREAARLQTFPDNYIFCGPRTSQYQQVGNAVPPDLARQIAGVVAGILS
jgi:DNA (cytosine-5)-methyltransferase 1